MKAAELVDLERGRVHMHAYTDQAVFAEEMRRIFHRTWIYVGHESEVTAAGDYTTSHVGQIPVILSRDEDGGLNVLVNRCAHRGTTVCQRERGTANYFKCEYHGWVYDNKGALTGVSLSRGYGDGELPAGLGLQRLPRVDSYRGLVFACLDPDVEPLPDFLGLARPYLDDWAAQTPEESVALEGGSWRLRYNGNWKLQVENSTEGYHPDFLHQAAIRVQVHNSNRARAASGRAGEKRRPQRIAAMQGHGRDLGNGHNLVETPQVGALAARRYPADFVARLEQRYGPDRVPHLLGPPWRLLIFPNLSIAGPNIRVIQPLAVDRTAVRQHFVDLPTAPEQVRRFRREQERGFYGPAGYGGPDDVEMFERMQEGFRSASADVLDPWALFNRQLGAEEQLPSGERVGHSSSEITQRAVYRGWHRYMAGEGAGL